jgi:hypothetical protein
LRVFRTYDFRFDISSQFYNFADYNVEISANPQFVEISGTTMQVISRPNSGILIYDYSWGNTDNFIRQTISGQINIVLDITLDFDQIEPVVLGAFDAGTIKLNGRTNNVNVFVNYNLLDNSAVGFISGEYFYPTGLGTANIRASAATLNSTFAPIVSQIPSVTRQVIVIDEPDTVFLESQLSQYSFSSSLISNDISAISHIGNTSLIYRRSTNGTLGIANADNINSPIIDISTTQFSDFATFTPGLIMKRITFNTRQPEISCNLIDISASNIMIFDRNNGNISRFWPFIDGSGGQNPKLDGFDTPNILELTDLCAKNIVDIIVNGGEGAGSDISQQKIIGAIYRRDNATGPGPLYSINYKVKLWNTTYNNDLDEIPMNYVGGGGGGGGEDISINFASEIMADICGYEINRQGRIGLVRGNKLLFGFP